MVENLLMNLKSMNLIRHCLSSGGECPVGEADGQRIAELVAVLFPEIFDERLVRARKCQHRLLAAPNGGDRFVGRLMHLHRNDHLPNGVVHER